MEAWVGATYCVTVAAGVAGNLWVIGNVLRSRRPKNNMQHRSASDRLRSYIAVLAVIDLTVLMVLLVRALYLWLPQLQLDNVSCRAMFILERAVKLASLTCISCISLERYITIRKPFCSSVRKRFVQLTPLVAAGILTATLSLLLLQASAVVVSSDGANCVLAPRGRIWPRFASYFIAFAFIAHLIAVSLNYGQIVRHVRRKFWKRKARASTHRQESLVSEPRYMREMTSAIVRVGLFHVLCWLPICILQLAPDPTLLSALTASLRPFDNFTDFSWMQWLAAVASWLSFANAAGDWIFYAVLNRDLRNLIRLTTERRKRSTMSQQASPSNLHRSLRQQVSSSLRFFQSIHSYRSSAGGSFDDGGNCPASLVLVNSPKSSVFSHGDTIPSPKFTFCKKPSILIDDEMMV